MKLIEFSSINKCFDERSALSGVNFYINEGEFVAILGVNGSGKSTIFNLMMDILEPDKGEIKKRIHNKDISYIQQNYRDTLLPWKNNFDNISLPLSIKGYSKKDYAKKTAEIIKQFDMEVDLKKFPYQLSGGQQQQLAILRGLITEPKLLLLDEPFAALDFGIKREISNHLLGYWAESGATIVLITHDIDEAILLADRIIILKKTTKNNLIDLDINFDRPRSLNVMASVKFGEIKKSILELLYYG